MKIIIPGNISNKNICNLWVMKPCLSAQNKFFSKKRKSRNNASLNINVCVWSKLVKFSLLYPI